MYSQHKHLEFFWEHFLYTPIDMKKHLYHYIL